MIITIVTKILIVIVIKNYNVIISSFNFKLIIELNGEFNNITLGLVIITCSKTVLVSLYICILFLTSFKFQLL